MPKRERSPEVYTRYSDHGDSSIASSPTMSSSSARPSLSRSPSRRNRKEKRARSTSKRRSRTPSRSPRHRGRRSSREKKAKATKRRDSRARSVDDYYDDSDTGRSDYSSYSDESERYSSSSRHGSNTDPHWGHQPTVDDGVPQATTEDDSGAGQAAFVTFIRMLNHGANAQQDPLVLTPYLVYQIFRGSFFPRKVIMMNTNSGGDLSQQKALIQFASSEEMNKAIDEWNGSIVRLATPKPLVTSGSIKLPCPPPSLLVNGAPPVQSIDYVFRVLVKTSPEGKVFAHRNGDKMLVVTPQCIHLLGPIMDRFNGPQHLPSKPSPQRPSVSLGLQAPPIAQPQYPYHATDSYSSVPTTVPTPGLVPQVSVVVGGRDGPIRRHNTYVPPTLPTPTAATGGNVVHQQQTVNAPTPQVEPSPAGRRRVYVAPKV